MLYFILLSDIRSGKRSVYIAFAIYLTFPVSFALLLSWCYTVACQTKQPSWTLLSHSFVWATHDFQLLEHVDTSVDHQEEQEEKAMENRPRFTFLERNNFSYDNYEPTAS